MQAVLVNTQILVGRQRLAIGVLDRNSPVADARVHVRVYRGSSADPQASDAVADYRSEGLEGKGIYVAYVSFAAAGQWTGEITMQRGTAPAVQSRVAVNVGVTGSVPAPGQAAPASRNPTRRDVADVRDIDSGDPPDDMHELSIADAIAQHRPALVVFATPAFCTSATCGPEVHAVQLLEPAYGDRVAFIHAEIYQDFRPDPAKIRFTPTVQEWRLQSEPWVFLIDRTGTIAAAFEGPTATDELRAALDALLAR
ncbi:MAG TPA: hypothetical protein VHG53_07025 [Candidatus Limnocylindria bacterium]|nr:hypothetical protein [Candidatus Limnocylindria bacterium]